ncbi:prolyl oligopeptidase family serine peptidase [Paenibacillus andongensis]|uniref:prolyl oligopeptidase family serine peptidase n=1 Tax=Paenibacillus andongensis TaxID=2975482 RepID=UPI0021BB8A66|nr:prolyl oligopeptidase family serine peptidase [Paenibacillus andongensis]
MGRSYYTITEITDYGPFITKLVLPMPVNVTAEAVNPQCFSVYVERKDQKGEILMLPTSWVEKDIKKPSKGYCVVKDVYPSSQYGRRTEEGEYVTLEMKYGPNDALSAAIAAPNGMNVFVASDYRVTQIAEVPAEGKKLTGLVFDKCAGNTMKQAEKFLHGISSYEDEPLKYGYFVPQTGNGRRPLIIWLHGAGEGGQDPTIAYAGNKVVNLASDEIQAKFGGAFVLVPQTPTFWMNDGSGEYGRSGKSMYGKALKALIDEFISRNDAAIDTNRIYIGGCSNGGFMTMRMVLDYPDFFAAAYPVCEALYNEVISDADIEAIKHVPIWFTHSKDDLIVKPEETAVPTFERLLKAGAKSVHFSLFDKVVDLHGLFTDEKGEPYTYNGHFSWVYALNDDCLLDYDGKPVVEDGKEVSLMAWLARQRIKYFTLLNSSN